MSTWVGIAPLTGAGSLDGFAIGALASGACFMAITAPRRARKRQAAAAAALGGPAGGQPEWLCEHVMAAEAFPEDEERLVAPESPGLPDLGPASPAGREGRPAAGRHRLGDPNPGGASPGREAAGSAEGGFAGSALPAGTSRPAAFPDSAFPESALHGGASRGAHRAGGLPDLAFPDGAPGTSRRPDTRRLPRHAAPAVGLGRRMGNRLTGLIAARALIGGAHG